MDNEDGNTEAVDVDDVEDDENLAQDHVGEDEDIVLKLDGEHVVPNLDDEHDGDLMGD